MNKNRTGLVLGSFLALVHFIWVIMVAIGWAQPFMNFIFNLHHLNNPFSVLPFNAGLALGLIVTVFVLGYAFGFVFAYMWNKLHR